MAVGATILFSLFPLVILLFFSPCQEHVPSPSAHTLQALCVVTSVNPFLTFGFFLVPLVVWGTLTCGARLPLGL